MMEEKVKYGLISCGLGIIATIFLFIGNNAGWLSFTTQGFWQVFAMIIAWPTILSFAWVGLYVWSNPSFQTIAPFLLLLAIILNLVYLYILGLIVYKIKNSISKNSSNNSSGKKKKL